jgi:hypothetical protein
MENLAVLVKYLIFKEILYFAQADTLIDSIKVSAYIFFIIGIYVGSRREGLQYILFIPYYLSPSFPSA